MQSVDIPRAAPPASRPARRTWQFGLGEPAGTRTASRTDSAAVAMRADRAHHGDEEAAYLAYCRDQEEGPVHEAESADEAIKVATERAKRLVADERLRLT